MRLPQRLPRRISPGCCWDFCLPAQQWCWPPNHLSAPMGSYAMPSSTEDLLLPCSINNALEIHDHSTVTGGQKPALAGMISRWPACPSFDYSALNTNKPSVGSSHNGLLVKHRCCGTAWGWGRGEGGGFRTVSKLGPYHRRPGSCASSLKPPCSCWFVLSGDCLCSPQMPPPAPAWLLKAQEPCRGVSAQTRAFGALIPPFLPDPQDHGQAGEKRAGEANSECPCICETG